MLLLIRKGTVINPADQTETVADVLVEDGIIKKIAPKQKVKADRVVDANGCYVMPGFIDLHVHLRDPGQEHKETVETGARAAAHGGFTTIVAMPNTKPAADNEDVINYVHNKARDMRLVHVLQAGAVTKGQRGEELSDIVARDIMLAKDTGASLHLCHCSTKDSVRMIELAKQEGIRVTAEVCPHHFTLSSEDIPGDDANYKMNPPLRTKADVEALREGLKNDIIDVIATDHAPHTPIEKGVGIKKAPFGIVGLETAAAITMTELVDKGILTIMQMAEKMSYNPAKILGLDKGTVEEGKTADLVVFHPEKEYVIEPNEFKSKGRNTPFAGKKVKGMVMATIVDGRVIYERA